MPGFIHCSHDGMLIQETRVETMVNVIFEVWEYRCRIERSRWRAWCLNNLLFLKGNSEGRGNANVKSCRHNCGQG
jgi:hypothetical protein